MVLNRKRIARYESVAHNIAEHIVQGRYLPGTRLHGRSTLASLYKVSPETIRKSMAILEKNGVVEVIHGSGTLVLSVEKAGEYLQSFNSQYDLDDLLSRIRDTLNRQKALTQEMESLMREVIAVTRRD